VPSFRGVILYKKKNHINKSAKIWKSWYQ